MTSQKEFFIFHNPETMSHDLYKAEVDSVTKEARLYDLGEVEHEDIGEVFYNPEESDYHLSLYDGSHDLTDYNAEKVEADKQETKEVVEHIMGQVQDKKNDTNRNPFERLNSSASPVSERSKVHKRKR